MNYPNPDIENTIIAQPLSTSSKSKKCLPTNEVAKYLLDSLYVLSDFTLFRISISGFGNYKFKCFLLLLWVLPVNAIIVTVGGNPECTYQNLQKAINDSLINADTENELRLVNDGNFNHQSFKVHFTQGKNLTIIGGYESCDDAHNNVITDKTIIDAEDTEITSSIFTITSDLVSFPIATIALENLILTGSQAILGGAISFSAVQLTLTNSDLIENQAQFGGAVSCNFTDGFQGFLIYDSVFIDNHASSDGGAIYIHRTMGDNSHTEGCRTVFNSQNRQSRVSNNHADNNGGGIFVDDGAGEVLFANDTINRNLASVMISNNSAINGGGIYQTRGQGEMFDIIISDNHASQLGGALYLGGSEEPGSFLSICGSLINNSAGISGGAVYADYFSFGTRASWQHKCKKSLFKNNSAPIAALAENVNGASFKLGFGNSVTTIENHENAQSLIISRNPNNHVGRIQIDNAILKNNRMLDSLFDIEKTETWIRKSLITDNQVNENIAKKNGFTSTFKLDRYFLNTITGNTIGLNVLNVVETKYAIIDNIIWQNDNTLFNISDSEGEFSCNIVSSESNSFDGIRNTVIDPQFVNPENANYHLKFSSRAIDYCSHNQSSSLLLDDDDFYDWQEIDNLFGEVDIGAFRYEDDVFKSSFE